MRKVGATPSHFEDFVEALDPDSGIEASIIQAAASLLALRYCRMIIWKSLPRATKRRFGTSYSTNIQEKKKEKINES
jgi:hypothetical protein